MLKFFKKRVKKLVIKLTQNVGHLKKSVNCNHIWYGQDLAGFFVCPDLLNESSVVYSFGIGQDISFDKALINDFNCKVYGFDPTPKSIDWLKGQETPNRFAFFDFGIGVKTEDTSFFLPINDDNVSGSLEKHVRVSENKRIDVHMKSLDDILRMLGHNKIDVLKMDIEGSEYDIIESFVQSDVQVDQLLIEFHDRFFDSASPKSLSSVRRLNEKGYEIFAVSDSFEEVSFIRKGLI
ncbi:FkbM family methyltransferase [Flagellimonas flava]|uniref:Methyltransferase, FkbM family n=1 Tax=Flagellimonas flava TaxID=570519 RepID=A0A1M5L1Z9_9FLAO|nr:FkbM family methyltransferase [Allomuricauda flava]SHG58965.1 methyltransferase, FkbM family [Allomuricauda flava]